MPRLLAHRDLQRLLEDLSSLGWDEVAVDPEGYRTGSMNATLVTLGMASAPPAPLSSTGMSNGSQRHSVAAFSDDP